MNAVVFTALFVAFLWGLTPVIHKHVLSSIRPTTVMVLGGIMYFACIVAYAVYHRDALVHDVVNLTPSIVMWVAVASILTGFVANILYMYALKDEQSYVISALIYSSPAFTLLIAYLFLHEKLTIQGVVGVLLIVAGVTCLALGSEQAEEDFRGDVNI